MAHNYTFVHLQTIQNLLKMNKNDYQKPTMTVVELRHRTQLLTGSTGMEGRRNSYGEAIEEEWKEEDEEDLE